MSHETYEMEMNMNEAAGHIEMPQYKSHKTVHALKITHIVMRPDGGAEITPSDPDGHGKYAGFVVDADYMNKHLPLAGGYYVVYADGYKSFSPAKAFEDGYTRI